MSPDVWHACTDPRAMFQAVRASAPAELLWQLVQRVGRVLLVRVPDNLGWRIEDALRVAGATGIERDDFEATWFNLFGGSATTPAEAAEDMLELAARHVQGPELAALLREIVPAPE